MADGEEAWEATVATALRDAQWLWAGSNGLPGLYASLSGKVENKHGDTIFQSGARFFLFELKGGPSLLSTEWTDTRTVESDGGKKSIPNPKPLHQASVRKGLEWNPPGASKFSEPGKSSLLLSLRGHHFVYWDRKSLSPYDPMSGIVVAPYVTATFHALAFDQTTSSEISKDAAVRIYNNLTRYLRFNTVGLSQSAHPSDDFASSVPLSHIFEGKAFFSEKSTKEEGEKSHPVGLTVDELEVYIDELAKVYGSRDDRMKAIVMSDTGFYRSVDSMSQLARVFHPHPSLVQGGPSPRKRSSKPSAAGGVGKLPSRPRRRSVDNSNK